MWATVGVKGSVLEKMQAIKAAGFEGTEMMSHMDQDEVLRARDATGLTIPSVCGRDHWKLPLSSPDPKLREGDVIEPTVEEISAATRVLRTVPEPTLYARVDLVPDRAGPPRLMELELIEPALFLGSLPGASDRLARAIRDQLSAPRR